MDEEVFGRTLEKLWVHGGAVVDPEENVRRGQPSWRPPYLAQRQHKLDQLGDITRCAEAHGCRMLHLVQHFGDQEDSGKPCGVCDACAPAACVVRRFRRPTLDEERRLARILGELSGRDGQSTGQLFRAVHGEGAAPAARRGFERLLASLGTAGLVRIEDDAFEKDGRLIRFQRAALTDDGWRAGAEAARNVLLAADVEEAPRRSRRREAGPAERPRSPRSPRQPALLPETEAPEPSAELVAALKAWRLAEARKRGVPAFHILTDRTLLALAAARPADEEELLAVRGIGPTLVRRYGEELLRLVASGAE